MSDRGSSIFDFSWCTLAVQCFTSVHSGSYAFGQGLSGLLSRHGEEIVLDKPLQIQRLARVNPDRAPVERVLRWLGATRHLKVLVDEGQSIGGLRESPRRKALKLFTICERSVAPSIERPCVGARCLDCCAMLTFRAYYASLDQAATNLCLWCDSSPQWRGVKLSAASLDSVSTEGGWIRQKAPGACCLDDLSHQRGAIYWTR